MYMIQDTQKKTGNRWPRSRRTFPHRSLGVGPGPGRQPPPTLAPKVATKRTLRASSQARPKAAYGLIYFATVLVFVVVAYCVHHDGWFALMMDDSST